MLEPLRSPGVLREGRIPGPLLLEVAVAVFFGWLLPLLVVAVIVAVVFAVRGGGGRPDREAEQALARRYAEGDIDEEEYRERAANLSASRPRRSSQSTWALAIAVAVIVLLVVALLWGGMGSGWMWDTMDRHMDWTQSVGT